ncbi:MAG: OFA family MFS transporter [Syntrophales bacterium]|nr:OFA family MFS transporter [Syntrophales bacterium]MDD5233812.1 OFA family MFS transporter [Syntrophales bacterium]HPL62642.1 OFA family MFS transporter [Syntrophales bacterium]
MDKENLESKRWLIAGAAVIMQLCLGTVYAWSVFKKPLMGVHQWAETETQMAFIIFMFTVGVAAAFGGTLVDKKGPKFVATAGGVLFGIGTLLSGLADQMGSLFVLYLGYGLIGGLGNGFCYVTPIATLIRWFPDKRGLVTGLAVMGFGFGAFFMGQIAPKMIIAYKGGMTASGVALTFYIWGVIFLALVVGAAQLFKNPPKGWLPAGFTPSATTVSAADSFNFGEAAKTPQWWMLWSMLFLNVSAGLGLISQLSPIAQDLYKPMVDPALSADDAVKVLATAGGAVVAYSAIFNGLGRLFWARVSDTIGRKAVFATMFASQAVIYALVATGFISGYTLFMIAACYLLACYGGGFATMPAFAADSFGPGYIGKVYGFMLTAWACAGIAGPLVFAQLARSQALLVAAALLVAGLVVTLIFKRPERKKVEERLKAQA